MIFTFRRKQHREGFSPLVDGQRLLAIRWKANRSWKAWHIHDIRFLLSIIDRMGPDHDLPDDTETIRARLREANR